MRIRLIVLGLMTSLTFCSFGFTAEEPRESVGESMTEESISEVVEVGNKICPVSGESVDINGEPVKYEYNGKIYSLCCTMCLKDFKKDPEKYVKIIEETMAEDHDKPDLEHKDSHDHGEHGGHE